MEELVKNIYHLDTFPILCAYMLMVLLAGQWKKYTKPAEMKLILVVYNLGISALNLISVVTLLHGIFHSEYILDMRPSDAMKPAYKIHLYMKTIKLFDTAILVLRHKQHQIIFYHVFNHVSLLIFADVLYNYHPCTAIAWIAAHVCFGHILWHLYFALSAINPDIPAPWKNVFKYLDVIEFSIHVVHTAIGYVFGKYCVYSVFYSVTILSLFCKEYYIYLL